MNRINWKVRIANKTFWLSLIPAALLLVQVVASVFGFTLESWGTSCWKWSTPCLRHWRFSE